MPDRATEEIGDSVPRPAPVSLTPPTPQLTRDGGGDGWEDDRDAAVPARAVPPAMGPVGIAPAVPAERRVWVQPLAALFAWGAGLGLFLYFFDSVSTVLLGLLAAATVACALKPLLRYIPGPRGLSAATLGLALLAATAALLLALSWPLAGPIQREWNHWPETQRRVNAFLGWWSHQLGLDNPTTAELLSAERRSAAQRRLPSENDLSNDDRQAIALQVRAEKRLTVEKILENLGSFLAGEGGQRLFSHSADVMFGILVWVIFIFVGSMFLLAEPGERLVQPALALISPRHRPAAARMLEELGPKLRRWAIGTSLGMSVVFTASFVGYLVIGLPLALPLALLAGLCEIVPTVGPAMACVVACLFAAATAAGSTVAGVVVVYLVIQSLEAYLILPMIMRGAVNIHPAVTLFSVILWGKVFGVPGLMLAIPINLTLWGAAEHFLIRRHREATSPAPVPTGAAPPGAVPPGLVPPVATLPQAPSQPRG